MEGLGQVENRDHGLGGAEPCSGSDLDEAARQVRAVRQACRAFRLGLVRGCGFDAAAGLLTISQGLREAAGGVGPERAAALAARIDAVSFAPGDPYAGILAAEEALELLEESLDRRRFARWRGSGRPRAVLVGAALAVLLAFGLWRYALDRDSGPVIDVLAGAGPAEVHTTGINTVTENGGGKVWRWAYGPQTEIWFKAGRAGMCVLDLAVYNMIPGQVLTIRVNDDPGESFEPSVGGFEQPAGTLRLPFMTRPGQNIVRIAYADWNKKGADFAPGDARPLSVAYGKLRIEPVGR
jgi:hypothetical protein